MEPCLAAEYIMKGGNPSSLLNTSESICKVLCSFLGFSMQGRYGLTVYGMNLAQSHLWLLKDS